MYSLYEILVAAPFGELRVGGLAQELVGVGDAVQGSAVESVGCRVVGRRPCVHVDVLGPGVLPVVLAGVGGAFLNAPERPDELGCTGVVDFEVVCVVEGPVQLCQTGYIVGVVVAVGVFRVEVIVVEGQGLKVSDAGDCERAENQKQRRIDRTEYLFHVHCRIVRS